LATGGRKEGKGAWIPVVVDAALASALHHMCMSFLICAEANTIVVNPPLNT
jgi:hypothetical protein